MRRTPITQQGALRLQEELDNLKRVAGPPATATYAVARAHAVLNELAN